MKDNRGLHDAAKCSRVVDDINCQPPLFGLDRGYAEFVSTVISRRKELGLSRHALAKSAGVSLDVITAFEWMQPIGATELNKILDVLGLQIGLSVPLDCLGQVLSILDAMGISQMTATIDTEHDKHCPSCASAGDSASTMRADVVLPPHVLPLVATAFKRCHL
jgi:hypothetical protein